jgi:tetratricopeptide (TPR) repeat protein
MSNHDRRGFIFIVGTRTIVSNDHDSTRVVRTRCPQCGQEAEIVSKSFREWVTFFFLPVFPITGKRRFSECSNCHAHFPITVEELSHNLSATEQQQSQQGIALYNSLRNSPANSITLNDLMQLYASMREYDQAISAAGQFPDALNASEQCMSTLGRVYLAKGDNAEAIKWFDAAIARNDMLGEAHYHKAIALLTLTPPDPAKAVQAARAARTAGYPRSDELLRDAEERIRQQHPS